MKPSLLTLLLFFSISVFAHKDFWMTKDFGNVKVRIKTGFHYEEIKKSWIIGELAYRFCQQEKYTRPVFIDFNHHYVETCEPDYFLSIDNGTINYKWSNEKQTALLNNDALIIREVSRQFTPSATLALLEYAIHNAKEIKSTQKTIDYNQNYCEWKINSIDTLLTKKIASGKTSFAVNKILAGKVYRE